MNKHAYLIAAHNQFELLEMIIRMLDNEKNDFFIHIDKSVKNFNFEYFKQIVKFSKITFVKREKVVWGSYKQIKYELNLLNAAIKGNYSYYHLISGCDLPLKTSDEIYNFFESHNGTEFINFGSKTYLESQGVQERIRLYHPLQGIVGRKQQIIYKILRKLQNYSLSLQRLLHIDRLKNSGLTLRAGANWFSITHELAVYFCSQESIIKKYFNFSWCADEVVLQTIAYSKYKDTLKLYHPELAPSHKCCARHIDWIRGEPYTFRSEDYDEIMNSSCMFARKFDLNLDKQICYDIYNHVMGSSK